MTLYEIDQSLLDIMEAVDPETGEWTGDPEAWERLNLERDVKLENTACYIKDLRGKIVDFKAEIKTLQQRQKTLENKEAWLLDNLKRSLDGSNLKQPDARSSSSGILNPLNIPMKEPQCSGRKCGHLTTLSMRNLLCQRLESRHC